MKLGKTTPLKTTRYNSLEVSVGYEKGGINYFNGQINRRGIYAYFTPMSKENDGTFTCTILGNEHECGFKVFLKETSRKNDKALQKFAEVVLPHAERIADLYDKGEKVAIVRLVQEITIDL